jgi:hypothetical protein
MAASFRFWGKLGYGDGVAGHITVRDPILTDHFWSVLDSNSWSYHININLLQDEPHCCSLFCYDGRQSE